MPYNPNVIYHNIFNGDKAPILIVEHIGKGYEIISHSSILNNIEDNIKVMYEIIMHCYLNRYKTTTNLTQWITSEIPDYQIDKVAKLEKIS